jgi:hypothetical protein
VNPVLTLSPLICWQGTEVVLISSQMLVVSSMLLAAGDGLGAGVHPHPLVEAHETVTGKRLRVRGRRLQARTG